MEYTCPVCNRLLQQGENRLETRIECPHCHSSFVANVLIEKSGSRPTTGDTGSSAAIPNGRNDGDAPDSLRVDIDIDRAATRLTTQHLHQRYRRQRARWWIGMATLVVLALATVASLYWATSVRRDAVGDAEIPAGVSDTRPNNENGRSASARARENADDPEGRDTTKSEPVAEPPTRVTEPPTTPNSPGPFSDLDRGDPAINPPRNLYKSEQTLRECWLKTQPFLVELRAETPLGPRFATGSIVDSRGWLLTSHRAMRGARRIDVRQARGSIDRSSEALLSDQVRGIVAADPTRDLVLLSINPRFATRFSDLPLAERDRIVGSQYLIQCQPPTRRYPWPAVETRVAGRFTTPELPTTFPIWLRKQGATAPDVRWIQHQQRSDLRVGALLLDDQGTVVAMNSSAIAENGLDLLAVPAVHITRLVSLGGNELQPLPVSDGQDAARDVAVAESDSESSERIRESDMIVVQRTSALRPLSEQLNRLGDRCQQFGWWPRDRAEAVQLREFAQTMLESDRQAERSPEESDHETIKRQMAAWIGPWRDHVNRLITENRTAASDFNRHFPDQLQSEGDAFVAVARVVHSAMESPVAAIATTTPGDTVGFQFISDHSRRIITNVAADGPPMPPDSLWLVIGERLPGHINLRNRDQRREKLLKTNVRFALPIDSH